MAYAYTAFISYSHAVGSGSVQILERASLRPVAQLDSSADARHIEFQSKDRILAVTEFQTGAQWRQLFVDRSLPVPCVEQ